MLATTTSETLLLLQEGPEIVVALRENVKAMRAQLDPRSEWVRCLSAVENPVMLLALKPELVAARNLSKGEQEILMQDIVDEA
jgi:serine palmitoyltransferase